MSPFTKIPSSERQCSQAGSHIFNKHSEVVSYNKACEKSIKLGIKRSHNFFILPPDLIYLRLDLSKINKNL